MTLDELEVKFTGDITDLQKKLKTLDGEVNGFNKNLEGIAKGVGAVFAADRVFAFTKEIIRVRGEFQKFEAVLTNTLGSRGLAKQALSEIQEFAAKTPFQVDQLTESYIRLANMGFVPTMQEMRKMGDLASSTGKDFMQLTEALVDAQVGEMERLKEFGVKASKQGDQVMFTFKGVQTQVENTEGAIRDYILSLGDAEGVTGSMEAVSKTLVGQVSNLEESWTQFMNKLGTLIEGPGAQTISWLTTALTKAGEFIDLINLTETDPALLGASLNSSAGEQLKNIEELTKRLEILRRDMNSGFALPFEKEKMKEEEKQILDLLKQQSEELGKQYAIDIARKKAAADQAAALEAERQRQKELDKLAKEKKNKKFESDPLAFFSVEDDISDADLDLSMFDNLHDQIAENLGQLAPSYLEEMKEYLAGVEEELDQFDALDKLTEDYHTAADASKKFSDQQKAAMANAALSAAMASESIGDAIRNVIKALIAQGITSVVANTLSTSMGPWGVPIAAAAGAAAALLFDQIIPEFAVGTPHAAGGMALVGERGPELVNLPTGASVTPNHRIGNYLGGDSGFVASTKIVGEDLLIMIERAQKKRDRLS